MQNMRSVKRRGTCGKHLQWALYEDGHLVVTGFGDMDDYPQHKTPWHADQESITALEIHSGVTSIGTYAFEACKNLACVVLPKSLTHIGQCAFEYCGKLTSIEFPEGMTHIGHCAFHYSGLTSLVIPRSITHIGGRAFAGCRITSIVLPENVVNLGPCPYTGGPDLFCKNTAAPMK